MEGRINKLLDEQDALEDRVQRLRRENRTRTRDLQDDQLEKATKAFDQKAAEVTDFRFHISIKESELLLVFREIEACDFYVPDAIFEQQVNPEAKRKKKEQYIVPMETFWKPVMPDGEVDLNLD